MTIKIYISFLIVRLVCVFLVGYVHPDEYFQNPQIVASDQLECSDLFRPWEFDPSFPCRSIVVP